MEILQATLYATLILLGLSLSILTIYAIFLLKDVKETISEANKIVKTANKVVSAVVTPITTLAGIFTGVTKGIQAIKSIGIFDEEDE